MNLEVLISADRTDDSGDLASLRAWLDAPGLTVPWELVPERPASGTLGCGVDEICAVAAALEGLPPLIQWIKSWTESKQQSPQITVRITIAGRSLNGNVGNDVADGEQAIDNMAGALAGHDHEPDT